MDVQFGEDEVSISLTREEAARLGVIIYEAVAGMSQAEFYIRTGLARASAVEIREVLRSQSPAGTLTVVELREGAEEVDNPRRLRPRPLDSSV